MAFKELPTIKTWSYSGYKCYCQCPLKAKFKRVDKLMEPGSPAMDRGTAIHQLAQDFVEGNLKSVPDELKLFSAAFKMLRKQEAECELEWGFNASWEPCAYMGKDIWLRVKTDVIYGDPNGALTIIDHKTGRIYDDHKEQLQLYALAGFLRNPNARQITAQDWYLDQDAMTEEVFLAEQMPALKATWDRNIYPMLHDTIFPAKPGPLCKYCHFRRSNGGPCSF